MRDRRAGRREQPADSQTTWLVLTGALLGLIALVALWVVGAKLDPTVSSNSANPVQLLVDQVRGRTPIGGVQLLIFVLGLLVLAATGAALLWAWRRLNHGRSRVDHLAKSMSRASDFAPMMGKGALADAERLHSTKAGPGVPLAKLVANRQDLLASWEWVQIWMMGPRAGKSSCVCIPQILETHGPVLATSNKRDIVDMTRGPRSREGIVYVHDPQQIIGEEPSWWWNPLSFVEDMETAERLTAVFVASATEAGTHHDAYFGADAKRALSMMFLAAAMNERPITDVFDWAQDPDDPTPRDLLLTSGHWDLGTALSSIQHLTPKQRDGVYGTLRPWLTVLSYAKVIPWISNPTFANRPHFDHRAFATSTNTLYLVSMEGSGSARAITAALVMAVMSSAEKTASRSSDGRLATPMMAVLDEAANVVRWPELPDVYSHYGSRGIIVSAFFQSYKQGVESYGEKGMDKLWGAANIRVVGSGLSDDSLLPFVEKLVGSRDVLHRSSSTSKGGRSTSTSMHRESILDVSDLGALPRGRAIMLSAGHEAALLELVHYSKKPYAKDVEASNDYYGSLAAQNEALWPPAARKA